MIAPVTRKARKLRNSPTDAERLLWRHLRGKAMDGARFRRQYPVGPYVADFASPELRLIIETDGGQHMDSEHDRRRDAYCRSLGYVVLRYWNHQVLAETESVMEDIHRWVEKLKQSPSRPPPRVGEEP